MTRMAAASGASALQQPRLSKRRRLALPSAVVRSSKLGWPLRPKGALSTRSSRTPVPASAAARLAPTSPPPMIATSTSRGGAAAGRVMRLGTRSAARHEGLDLIGILRRARGEHLCAAARHHDVVLDADADVAKAPGHAPGSGGQLDPRLVGHRLAGPEHPPLIAPLVVAAVLQFEPEPGAVRRL